MQLFAQGAYVDYKNHQQAMVLTNVEDTFTQTVWRQKLVWPPQEFTSALSNTIRNWKFGWRPVSGNLSNILRLTKVCMQSGTMGPKRMQGDYQVPEGFIISTNSGRKVIITWRWDWIIPMPDRILSDSIRPGNDILYSWQLYRWAVSPLMMYRSKRCTRLHRQKQRAGFYSRACIPGEIQCEKINGIPEPDIWWQNLHLQNLPFVLKAFSYFEEKKQLPVIMVNKEGMWSTKISEIKIPIRPPDFFAGGGKTFETACAG